MDNGTASRSSNLSRDRMKYVSSTLSVGSNNTHMSLSRGSIPSPVPTLGLNNTLDYRYFDNDDGQGQMVVVDTMPKHEYYLTLRQNRSFGMASSRSNSLDLLDSRSGTLMSRQYTGMSSMRNKNAAYMEKPDKKFMHGASRHGIPGVRCPEKLMVQFKPSNKKVPCVISLIDGRESTIEVDRESYGQHIFDAICEQLYLEETEHFSLTFYENKRTEVWLAMDKRVKDQIPKASKNCWYFQLRVRFYPYELDSIKDYLTQHLICTQVRQDLVNNTLPCSLYGRVSLGAAIIQSECGDYDPQSHRTIEYLVDQPLAPPEIQTREFLVAVRDTHRSLAGLNPEEADRLFLDSARKLALYGMHFHTIKSSDEMLRMGVYHNGLAIYREWLRIQRYTWASMLKFSYKGKRFILTLRGGSTSDKKGSVSRKASTATTLTNGNGKTELGAGKRPSTVSAGGSGKGPAQIQLQWKCPDESAARRLYTDCLHHHQFFRLRESRAPSRPILLPGYGTRKYTLGRNGELTERFATLDPLRGHSSGEHYRSNLSNASSVVIGGTPSQSHLNLRAATNGKQIPASATVVRPAATPSKLYHKPRSFSITEENSQSSDVQRRNARPLPPSTEYKVVNKPAGILRPDISRQEWSLSHGDRTDKAIICTDDSILYAPPGAGWQGARTTRGVRFDPTLRVKQNYYYEATLLADPELPTEIQSHPIMQQSQRNGNTATPATGPMLRVGWSTQSGSLLVGEDHEGFAYGCGCSLPNTVSQDYCTRIGNASDESCEQGVKVSHGVLELYGKDVRPGDVVGCEIDLARGEIKWSLNGEQFDRAYTLPNALRTEAFFPAITANSGGVKLNFGQTLNRRFRYAPPPSQENGMDTVTAVGTAPDSVTNNRLGWRLNPWDCTDTCELSPDGLMAQSKDSNPPGSWDAGARSNQGIQGPGNFYYEAQMLEPNGGWRVGYSTENASLQLADDQHGYAISVNPADNMDPNQNLILNLVCDGGKNYPCRLVNGDLACVRPNDIVGILIALPPAGAGIPGQLRFSLNGYPIQEVLDIEERDMREPFYPAAALSQNTVSFNFGNRPFTYVPPTTENWSSLVNAPTHQITLSKRRGNTRHLKGFSYLVDPQQLDPLFSNMNTEVGPHVIRPVSHRRRDSEEQPLSPLRPKQAQPEYDLSSRLSVELATRLQQRRSKIEAAESSPSPVDTTESKVNHEYVDPQLCLLTPTSPHSSMFAAMSAGASMSPLPPPPPPQTFFQTTPVSSQSRQTTTWTDSQTTFVHQSSYGMIHIDETKRSQFSNNEPTVEENIDFDSELDAAILAVLDLPDVKAEVGSVLERVQIHALQR